MPLKKNTFQPFFTDPNSPIPKDCTGDYCYPVSPGDIVRQQWYQTPCNASIVVDAEFEDFTLGAELITNGDFATNANDWDTGAGGVDATACPATVDSWCWNTGKLGHDGTDNNDNPVFQTTIGLVAGNVYKVVWTVSGRTQGSIYTQLGDTVGSTQGAVQVTNETFTEYLFYNDAQDVIQFFPSVDFDGNIDDVSCKLVTMTSWTGLWWSFDNGSACVATAQPLVGLLYNSTTDYITAGDYYEVVVDVTITAGSLQVCIDDGTGVTQTNVQTAITANGTYTYYITASQNGVIAFDPSADFVGCVVNTDHTDLNGNIYTTPSVRRLRNDFTFELINAAGDSVDISDSAIYTNQYIDVELDMATMYEGGDINYGCFTIYAYDACLISGGNLVQDGTFSNGDYSEWNRNSGAWQYNMVGGELEFVFEPLGDNPTLVTNGNFAGGDVSWTHDGSWTLSPAGAVHTPGSTTTLSQTITCSTPVPPEIIRTWWQVVVTGRTAGSITVTVSDQASSAYTLNDTITGVMGVTVYGAVTLAITPTSTFDGTITLIAVHESSRAWNWNCQVVNPANVDVVAGNYQLTYENTSVTGTTANTIGSFAMIQYPLIGITYDTGIGIKTHQQSYTPGNTLITIGGKFFVNALNNYYPGRTKVDDFTVVRIEPFEATYISECLNFQASHEGTTLVTGWCDQDALGSTFEDALGFATTGYLLQMRVRCRSLNPIIKTEGNNAFFGNGSSAVKYAQMEKYWQFVTDYLSESALTTLGGIIRCDHFTIGDEGEDSTEYLAEMDDLSPGWLQDGSYNLAPVTINIRTKEKGMKFNRHI